LLPARRKIKHAAEKVISRCIGIVKRLQNFRLNTDFSKFALI